MVSLTVASHRDKGDTVSQVIAFPSRYQPEAVSERPVTKQTVAHVFGVSTRTVDRWVERDRMPHGTPSESGCWIQAGAHRRYYLSRVRAWLDEFRIHRILASWCENSRVPDRHQYAADELNSLGILTDSGREWSARAVQCAWAAMQPQAQTRGRAI